jgi:low affinity Fe/Cu permease
MSQWCARRTGSAPAFAAAAIVVLIWLASGPIFHYSDTWQLVINTGTTIVTFLMVFLIQRAQNKDALAIQLKLNEIVAALPRTSNRLIDIESLDERELEVLREHFHLLAALAKHEGELFRSHSVDETHRRHDEKHREHHNADKHAH